MKLDTNYPWVKRIQVCSNKEPDLLQSRDNHKKVEMGWGHLIIFPRITGPISTRLGINHPWERRFKFVEMKGIALLQREVIPKELKYTEHFFLNLLLHEPLSQN
jgi:hypothetical protein